MTNDQMTALQFTIITVLLEHHKSLLAPVLQHLANGVVGYVATLHRYRVLHSLLKSKLDIQSLKDRVVLAALLSLTILSACIVATLESILDAVAEEVEGILQ